MCSRWQRAESIKRQEGGGASHACAGMFVHIRGMHSRALSCNAVLTGAYRIDPKKRHPTWIKTIATRGRCGVGFTCVFKYICAHTWHAFTWHAFTWHAFTWHANRVPKGRPRLQPAKCRFTHGRASRALRFSGLCQNTLVSN